MTRRIAWLCPLVVVSLVVSACPTRPTVFTPSPERAAGLPASVAELIALSDRLAAERPDDPHAIDRSLAALEAAEAKGPEEPVEVVWRMGRACFLLAEALGAAQGKRFGQAGEGHAQRAIALASDRVEGHYYHALNMAKVAEATKDVEQLKPMMVIARAAADIDPAFDDAGPLRLMGKTYVVAPEWPTSVGDREQAVEVLKQAVSLAPTPLNRLFLGEALYHSESYEAAEAQIQRALKDGRAGGLAPRWISEGEDYLRRLGVL